MVLGVLGGIGSGKSTVARLLVECGAESIDADALSHQVLRDPEVARRVRALFGDAVFGADGEVDRRRVAAVVFGGAGAREAGAGGADGAEREAADRAAADREAAVSETAVSETADRSRAKLESLEAILHPEIRRRIVEAIEVFRSRSDSSRRVLVLDVPLLIDTPLEQYCDAFLFVDATKAARRERTRGRGWSPDELERRESLQSAIERKRARADAVIENDGSLEALREKVERYFSTLVTDPRR
jgi:dephospho-CoA kinase